MAIQNWPKTNTSGDWASVDGIVWSENQAANTVNDSARAMGRDLAKWHGDTNATLTTGGSSNAYTLTSNGSYGSLANGFCISIKANHTNTGAATLNVDSLGAKAIRKFNASGEAALSASDIVNGGHYILQYNTAVNAAAGGWVLLNPNTIVTGDIADDAVTTAKIAADQVTYAKMQNISATQRVLGRNTSGAGDTEEVTATQVLDWLGSTRGHVLFRNATVWTVLSPGTSGQFLKTNGAGADPAWADAATLTRATATATTSGTSVDFTSVPSTVKRIMVIFNGVSTNGTSIPMVQIGDSGGVENSGYDAVSSTMGTGVVTTTSSTGFTLHGAGAGGASALVSGVMTICNISGNIWVASFHGASGSGGQATCIGGGTKELSATLDRVRITTVGGSDTFDAGSVTIMYE